MEPYENFKPRCNIDEAINLSNELTPDIAHTIYDCYGDAYMKKMKNIKEVKWLQSCSLNSVYMLGFISGSRAVRERKKTIST